MSDNDQSSSRIRLPEEDEVLGQVIQMLGNRMLLVRCMDGVTRKVRISGKHRYRMWVKRGDVIALQPHYGMQADRGTMTYRYKRREARKLYQKDIIPEEYVI